MGFETCATGAESSPVETPVETVAETLVETPEEAPVERLWRWSPTVLKRRVSRGFDMSTKDPKLSRGGSGRCAFSVLSSA